MAVSLLVRLNTSSRRFWCSCPLLNPCLRVLAPAKRFRNSRTRYSTMEEAANCTLLDASNIETFLGSFDSILTDCDGVLWNDNDPIPGAPETIRMLKEMGKRIFYVTNNSSKTREEYTKKCSKLGLPAEKDDVIGSAYVTAQYIKNVLKYEGKVYMIGSTGLKQELDNAGIANIGLGKDDTDLHGMNLLEMASQPLDPELKCVVVGMDMHFNYSKMTKALCYLLQPDCLFVSTNTDSVLPLGPERALPGTGSIVAAVETAAGRKSIVCGKPSKIMFEVAREKHNIDPARTIMIGDRCNTDIALGHNCGMRTLLVLTGFSQLEHVEDYKKSSDPEEQKQVPHYFVPSLSVIRDLISLQQ